eukprot:COSAG01_NODE_11112_length_2005_cov_2.076076_2_plen_42_part_00
MKQQLCAVTVRLCDADRAWAKEEPLKLPDWAARPPPPPPHT